MAVVNQFVEAFTKRDLNGILALLAPDPDVVFIGTGADEKRLGLADVKALFERDLTQSEEQFIKPPSFYFWFCCRQLGYGIPFLIPDQIPLPSKLG